MLPEQPSCTVCDQPLTPFEEDEYRTLCALHALIAISDAITAIVQKLEEPVHAS